MNAETKTKGERIEERIDRNVTGGLTVYGAAGSTMIAPQSMNEVMEFAKMMSVAGVMIRAAFRNNPGACLGICMQSFRWGMDPFAVVNKAYVVKNKAGEEQIAYEAQLVHAVINTRAPLKGRLKTKYDGEGTSRRCIVTGMLKGETEADVYESPELGKISVKNSPLWQSDPDQQLHYYATRAFARRVFPEVLLGIYTPDEIEAQELHYGPDNAKDITPDSSRPSVKDVEQVAEVPAEPVGEYPLIDESGEPEQVCTSPEQWASEFMAATAATLDGTFTEKALKIAANNQESSTQIVGMLESDDIAQGILNRYLHIEAFKSKPKSAPPEPGAGAAGASAPQEGQSPAAPIPQTEPVVTPPPVAAVAAVDASPQASTAAHPIVMPMSTKTGKADSAAYLLTMQKIMNQAKPEDIDEIMTLETRNLSVVMPRTKSSIEMWAAQRKAGRQV